MNTAIHILLFSICNKIPNKNISVSRLKYRILRQFYPSENRKIQIARPFTRKFLKETGKNFLSLHNIKKVRLTLLLPHPSADKKNKKKSMQQISATILTHNEEKQIARCVTSLRGVADEIIVIDCYSDDRTVEICKELGCHVTQRRMDGYGPLRQFATSLTRHAYNLTIDADEELSDELRTSIMRLKEEGMTHRVYSMMRRNLFGDRHVTGSGWENDLCIRLFNKKFANWEMHAVEEKVMFPDTLHPCLLEGDLIHHRCSDAADLMEKELGHSRLRALMIANRCAGINSAEPLWHAIGAFVYSYFLHNGYRQGKAGWHIARTAFIAQKRAWEGAREIITARNASKTPTDR